MRYLKSFNESLQNRREFIRLSDLEDMCKFNTKYFSTEIESWGDRSSLSRNIKLRFFNLMVKF